MKKNIDNHIRLRVKPTMTMVLGTALLLSFGVFTACNDFLSKNPDNRAYLNTPENIAGLLVSAYPQLSHIWFSELMSDNTTDVGPSAGLGNLTLRQAYQWERMDAEEQDSPDGYWYACYEAIASANHALDAIEKLEKEDQYSRLVLNPLKGEALLCRAYAHFMLVNLFAEHYNPATADSTAGIPYVTVPEVHPYSDYVRLSVAEVYELIEKDIQTGFPLIEDETYDAPKWHFNRQAAATFASRYYLYRGLPGDWDKVIDYSNLALDGNPTAFLREWIVSSEESFDVFGTNYSRSSNPANFLIISTVSTACRAWAERYSMTLNLLRKRILGDPHPTTNNITDHFVFINKVGGNTMLGAYGLFKYTEVFKRDGINANYGNAYVMNTPFVAEEALFNQMEAEVMKENYKKVIELLNLYYSVRLIDYSAVKYLVTDGAIQRIYEGTRISPDIIPHFSLNAKQKTYLKCVVNIRASEFLADGQRWLDIKRMHLPVIHTFFEGNSITLEPNDPRRVIPLPQDVGDLPFIPRESVIQEAPHIEITPLVDILKKMQKI